MSSATKIHTKEDYIGMRKAGRLAAEILDHISTFVIPGVMTEKLDEICHQMTLDNNATPAPLNYQPHKGIMPYPKSICTSKNRIVCHGIPDQTKLNEGDIINIDITVILDGYYGDSSRMYFVGDKISIKDQRLVKTTYDSLMLGIEQVKPGNNINQIGKAIQVYAESQGFSVVRDFCGHGIGKVFHSAPSILHYYDPNHNLIMEEGMFFTIEPMINAGKFAVKHLQKTSLLPYNDWIAVTKDGSNSAQFEHTLAVTKDGFEIFTLSPKGFTQPPYI